MQEGIISDTIPPLLPVVIDILAPVVAVVALLLYIRSSIKEKSRELQSTLAWVIMMTIHGVPVTLRSVPGQEVERGIEGRMVSQIIDECVFRETRATDQDRISSLHAHGLDRSSFYTMSPPSDQQ